MSHVFGVTNMEVVDILDETNFKEGFHSQKESLIKWLHIRSVRTNIKEYQALRKKELEEELRVLKEKKERMIKEAKKRRAADDVQETNFQKNHPGMSIQATIIDAMRRRAKKRREQEPTVDMSIHMRIDQEYEELYDSPKKAKID